MSYSISGNNQIRAEGIQIKVPKQLLQGRNGYADYYEIMVPHCEAEGLTDANIFVYKEDGDYLVIYNRIECDAAQAGYFDISYKTSELTYEYNDYQPGGGNPTEKNALGSLQATLTVTLDENAAEPDAQAQTGSIPVYMNTNATINTVKKQEPTGLYSSWNTDAWGPAPDNANLYYYLVWPVKTTVTGSTQPYNISLVDTFNVVNGDVVAIKMQGQNAYHFPMLDEEHPDPDYGIVRGLTQDFPNNGRIDYVITRHLKTYYDDIDEQNSGSSFVTYTLTNNVSVTVTPVDSPNDFTTGYSSATWKYEHAHFSHPGSGVGLSKVGLDYRGRGVSNSDMVRRYDLDKFYNNGAFNNPNMQTIPSLQYNTSVEYYSYPWTVPQGMSDDDPNSYGQSNVTFTLSDCELYLKPISGSYGAQLTDEDYRLTSVNLSWVMQDAEYNEDTMKFVACPVTYLEDEVIDIYVRHEGEWILAAQYDLYNGTGSLTSDAPTGVHIYGSTLYFYSGSAITGFKVETTNKHFYTKLYASIYLDLLNSETVQDAVTAAFEAEQPKIALRNISRSTATKWVDTENATLVSQRAAEGMEYVMGIDRSGSVIKEVTGYRNDPVGRLYRITWKIDASESYPYNSETVYLEQQSGVIYDLLPAGGVFDPDSLVARVNGRVASSADYTVEEIHNFNDTGRTLIKVSFLVPGKQYSISFTSTHSWDMIAEFGEGVHNLTAYETGNEDIGDGYPDNGGNLPTAQDRADMSGLDPACGDAYKFIYTYQNHSIDILTYGNLGLHKLVRSANQSSFSEYATVYNDTTYEYQIYFHAEDATIASDLIVLDRLESFIKDGQSSEWKGALLDVYLTNASVLDVAPVIWYTTDDTVDLGSIGKNYDFESDSRWVRKESFTGDHEDIVAFAVDLRHTANGEDFILQPDHGIFVQVTMLAPPYVDCDHLDPVTYNGTRLVGSVASAETHGLEPVWSDGSVDYGYTQTAFRIRGDLDILKVVADYYPSETVTIPGITFHLWGESDYGTGVDATGTTNDDGRLVFEKLELGTYYLQETAGSVDYLMFDDVVMTVTIDDHGVAHIGEPGGDPDSPTYDTSAYVIPQGDVVLDYVDGQYVIGNWRRIHADVILHKIYYEDGSTFSASLPGATFQLSGESEYQNDMTTTAVSDENGIVLFEKVELGSYEIKELSAPEGYLPDETTYFVDLSEQGTLTMYYVVNGTSTYLEPDVSGHFEIYNEPLHQLKIYKTDSFNGDPVDGAVFALYGTSDYGSVVLEEKTTGVNDENAPGYLVFDGLEPGTYTLEETHAPDGYVLDETRYKVVITNRGEITVTIKETGEAVELNELGWLQLVNEPEPEGVITIVKVWDDEEDPNGREIPKIHLTSERPEPDPGIPVATIKRSLWLNNLIQYYAGYSYNFTNPKPFQQATSFTRRTDLTRAEVTASGSGWIRVDDNTTSYRIYVKVEGENAYWWSDAVIRYLPSDSSRLFHRCQFDTLDLTGFNARKVIYFGENNSTYSWNASYYTGMFGHSDIKTINVTGWDVSNAKNFQGMFCNCSQLTQIIGLGGWNTGSAERMNYMFAHCKALTVLPVSGFNVSNLINPSSAVGGIGSMFYHCESITSLDLSGWQIGEGITSFGSLFEDCKSLTSLNVSNWDVSHVDYMASVFYGCESLTSLDLSGWHTSSLTSAMGIFSCCYNLVDLDISNFDTSKMFDFAMMFYECRSLTELDLSNFSTSSLHPDHYYQNANHILTGMDSPRISPPTAPVRRR